jgi:hypothetical protein
MASVNEDARIYLDRMVVQSEALRKKLAHPEARLDRERVDQLFGTVADLYVLLGDQRSGR